MEKKTLDELLKEYLDQKTCFDDLEKRVQKLWDEKLSMSEKIVNLFGYTRHLNRHTKENRKLFAEKFVEDPTYYFSMPCFLDLFNEVGKYVKATKGMGEMAQYDISLALAVLSKKNELLPQDVFIHRGSRIGAKKLFGKYYRTDKHEDYETLPKEYLQFFGNLDVMKIEDFLCCCHSSLSFECLVKEQVDKLKKITTK